MEREYWFSEYQNRDFKISYRVDKFLAEVKSPFQTIEVFENRFWGRVMVIDGLTMVTDRDEHFYHEALVHPALYTAPSPRRVLVVGGGDGGSLREVLKHPVDEAVLVEIDGEVIKLAKRYFPKLACGFDHPKAKVFIEDGARFIRESRETFDSVIIDSSEPLGPSAVLFGRPFYEAVREKLSPGGTVACQAGGYLFHEDFLESFSKGLSDLFPHACLYTGPTPTYQGGLWTYALFSTGRHPREAEWNPPVELRYNTRERFLASLVEEKGCPRS